MKLAEKDFLDKVEKFTTNPLQKREDVKKIIDAVHQNGKEEDFEKLIFTAKYISGLMRVLISAPGIPEVTSIEHVKNDLNENMKNGIEQLQEIISSGSESEREYFSKNYFTLSQQNISNLTKLFSDLESVKKYMNYIKRQT
jgi:hypothetical protein